MSKQIIFLGQTANDRTGDPLRVAFEKVNSNFDELYARTGDDLQIPALSGNAGKVLTNNGTTLSWGSGLSVSDFGEGFGLDNADKIVTNKLYSTNQTQPNQHYRLELDTNGVIHLPDQSIINGATLKSVAGNYAGITAGPVGKDEDSWMWVDNDGATIATKYSTDNHTWTFNNNGGLTFPQGTFLGYSDPGGFIIDGAVDKDIAIYTYSGADAHGWTFGTDGALTFPGTGTITNPSVVGNPTGTIHTFTADYNGNTNGLSNALSIRLPGGSPANTIAENWIITFANGATKTVTTSIVALPSDWDLFWTGNLTIASGADVWPLTVQSADYAVGTTTRSLELTPDGTTAWTFSSDGAVSSPNGSLQRNTAPVNCQGNASTVVYTVSGQYQHTIKLLIQVEGVEGVGNIFDTQACEMIIAKSFRSDDIAASVYGIVYTSAAPLATFNALWNALTSRVEVLCTTPGANSVNVKIFATEITTSD